MDADPEPKPVQFHLIDLFALTVLVAAACASIKISTRYLPPISELPVFGDSREGKNWFGQGGAAMASYSILFFGAVYTAKRVLLVCCRRQLAALNLFVLLGILSLPYIWFLCEVDWFNPMLYRVACWIGGPVMYWLVPAVSFLVDLSRCGNQKPLKWYLIRSMIEIVVVVPLWAVACVFGFLILGWAWI